MKKLFHSYAKKTSSLHRDEKASWYHPISLRYAASWIIAYPLITITLYLQLPGAPKGPEPFSIPLRGDVASGSIAGFHHPGSL